MKKGDTVWYIDYRMGGRLQFFQARLNDETHPTVDIKVEKIIYDDKSGANFKEGREYIIPQNLIYTKERLPKHKLMKWIFISLRRDK